MWRIFSGDAISQRWQDTRSLSASRACTERLHAVTIYYIKSYRLTSSDYRLPIQSISSTSLFVELEQPRQRHARREHLGWRIFVEKSRKKSRACDGTLAP